MLTIKNKDSSLQFRSTVEHFNLPIMEFRKVCAV